jgi:cytochrome c biogenesis protein
MKILAKIKDHFTSIRAILTVLAFLSIASAIGTVVPQNQAPFFYTQQYGPTLGQLIISTGLANLFRSWWFTAAEIWLVVSLLICTYYRGQFAVRLSRRDAKRGLGAWGLTVFHVGLVFILVTLMFTPRVQKEERFDAVPGQTVALTAQGFPFDLQVKDFQIKYYPDGSPKQYISRCAVIENGKVTRETDVMVNHPLRHRGVKVYQMQYGWLLGGRLTAGENNMPIEIAAGGQLPLGPHYALGVRFYPDFVRAPNGMPTTRSQEPKNPRVLYILYFQNQPVGMNLLEMGQEAELPGGKVVFDRYSLYTGLQAKQNPALPYTFAGFILSTAGVLLYLVFNPRRRPESGRQNATGAGER